MSQSCIGSWHIRPTPGNCDGKIGLKKTWTGPINTEIYGQGLTDLCNKTQDNLNRLSLHIKKNDPCTEYGIKHWHPSSRPQSALSECPATVYYGDVGQVDVIFSDNKVLESLNTPTVGERDSYIDPPARKTFCFLCSTLEEHKQHMLKHKPKKKYTGRPRIEYIAPRPKQKRKEEEEEDYTYVKERLYKIEVFTSDVPKAATTAKVFISIKGTAEYLPKTQLKKNKGCAQFCFMRATKETFHIKGPFLGHLQILTIEHDGIDRNQGWHLDRVHVTDVKAMKTWVFACENWLSVYEKPLYSNKVDLKAVELEHPPTVYSIEVYTGKQKMAGTDSKIYLTLYGEHGSSKKILLKDPSSDKRLFERNSVDKFQLQVSGVGELRKIRIEHDGKGFASGWFLDKVIIQDSERPNQRYYFMYGGWIARDEGEGKLWREITAKKTLPKELKSGAETAYGIIVKTGDVRYAGTDANVFIQMVGENGITKKISLDNPKNNFERNMVDNFEVRAVNVGPLKSIVIGHDNANPGAGWFLEKVTVRRDIPKEEAVQRMRAMRKRIKKENKSKDKRRKGNQDDDSELDYDSEDDNRNLKPKHRDGSKDKNNKRERKKKNLFSVSSSSESESSSDEEERPRSRMRRTGSATRRPGSAMGGSRQRKYGGHNGSSESESDSEFTRLKKRPQSGERKRSVSSMSRFADMEDTSSDGHRRKSKFDDNRYDRNFRDRRTGSASRERKSDIPANRQRHMSTSASSLRRLQMEENKDGDFNTDEVKQPLYEECLFMCNRWLATDEDDGLSVRELKIVNRQIFYKEKY